MMQCEQSYQEYRVNQVQFTGTLPGSVRSLVDFFIGVAMKQIKLTRGKWAMVDDSDYESLSQFKWYAKRGAHTYYAVREKYIVGQRLHPKRLRMHRVVIGASPDMQVDHINGDGLDNRRVNLRECTNAENQHNRRVTPRGSSRYKGVYMHRKKWAAHITNNYKTIYLGLFDTEYAAAQAYDAAARRMFGDFARPNFPAHHVFTRMEAVK